MTWQEALELVVARTRHEPYRKLCAEDSPDTARRDGYRALMVRLASPESDADRAARLVGETGEGPASAPRTPRRCCG